VTIFPSNTVGDILYIGGDTNFGPFPGIKSEVVTGVSPANGRLNGMVEPPTYHYTWEYWDGSAWIEFRIMTTDTAPPFTPFRRGSLNLGSYQIRFDHIDSTESAISPTSTFVSANTLAQRWVTSGTPSGNWAQNMVNGVTAFWMRVRLVSPLTIVPVLDQVKLHTNSRGFSLCGCPENFGTSRAIVRIVKNIKSFTASVSSTPANENMYLSDNIDLTYVNNQFSNGATDRLCNIFDMPIVVDTSNELILQWRWCPSDATAGNIQWTVRWGYTQDYAINTTVVSTIFNSAATAPTEGLTEQRITFTTPSPGVIRKQVTDICRMDISDLVANRTLEGDGDVFWVSLSRDGGADSYSGNVFMFTASIMGHKWHDGQRPV